MRSIEVYQTAIEKLDPIIKQARKQQPRRGDQSDRHEISLEGEIQGEKAEEKITRMRAAIEKAAQR